MEEQLKRKTLNSQLLKTSFEEKKKEDEEKIAILDAVYTIQ